MTYCMKSLPMSSLNQFWADFTSKYWLVIAIKTDAIKAMNRNSFLQQCLLQARKVTVTTSGLNLRKNIGIHLVASPGKLFQLGTTVYCSIS